MSISSCDHYGKMRIQKSRVSLNFLLPHVILIKLFGLPNILGIKCEEEVIAWYKVNKKDKSIVQSKVASLKLMTQSRGSRLLNLFAKNEQPTNKRPVVVPQESVPPIQLHLQHESDTNEFGADASDVENLLLQPQRKPAQEKLSCEIQKIKDKIFALISARSNGLSLSREQIDELRCLQKKRPEMEKKLNRLQQTEKASRKHRAKKRRIWSEVAALAPEELSGQMKSVSSTTVGRPPIECDQPGLLVTILNLVKAFSTADERRRCETLRAVKSLDQLLSELKNTGNFVLMKILALNQWY